MTGDDVASKPSAQACSAEGLGAILVDMGRITREQLVKGLEIHPGDRQGLTKLLVDQGLVAQEEVAMALSLYMNVPLIDLKRHQVQEDAISLIPERTARQYRLVPLDVVGDSLLVAMEDPGNIRAIEDLGAHANMGIQPAAGVPSQIEEAIDLNYRASAEIEQHVHDFTPAAESGGHAADFDTSDAVAQAAIVRALALIISQAVRDRASDIHIEPQEDSVRIRYRIDGVLHDTMAIPTSALNPLISRIKILAEMDITERRRPQDGQFSVRVDNRDVDIRAATIQTSHGETAVLRLLVRTATLFELTELGLQPGILEKYQDILKSSYGMILVAGPTGSGKTTTLYASINQLDRAEQSIMTIEDPIEYRFKDIKQLQVNEKAGITFASALRAMMRMDPDVILVGEIRDGETALTAIQAALTGHLVLSSIHANDAASVPLRLLDLGVEPYLIAAVVVGVVAQRMVRRTCPHCAASYEPSQEERTAYEREVGQDVTEMSHGTGCNLCSTTGFLERTGVFELLHFNEAVSGILLAGGSVGDIRAQAIKDGMVTIRQDGMSKVRQGITTPLEVMRQVTSAMEPTIRQRDHSSGMGSWLTNMWPMTRIGRWSEER